VPAANLIVVPVEEHVMPIGKTAWRRQAGHARSAEAGLSLVAVVVAVGLAGILALVLSSMIGGALKGQKAVDLRSDFTALKALVLSSIDCKGTFESVSPAIDPGAPGASCDSTSSSQVAPFLRLRRATANGSVQWLTGPLNRDGAARLGSWKVRVTCSDAEQSLIIRAARVDDNGNALKDPLTGFLQGWDAKNALIAGGDASGLAFPVCFAAGGAKSTTVGLRVHNLPLYGKRKFLDFFHTGAATPYLTIDLQDLSDRGLLPKSWNGFLTTLVTQSITNYNMSVTEVNGDGYPDAVLQPFVFGGQSYCIFSGKDGTVIACPEYYLNTTYVTGPIASGR
jgi:hypothetical protein